MTQHATEPASAMPRRIGWIGTGVMGGPMAGHLLKAGCELTIHTRTRQRAESLLAAGAAWAQTPAEAAAGADVVFSIVGMPADVEQTHLGERGTLAAEPLPRCIVDMTTSTPALAERLAGIASERGVGAIDAPVSGGDVGARNATLSVMVGGDERDVAYIMPLLEKMGQNIVHHGPAGAGQHTKMVNQILIAGTIMSVCEGLLYASAAGLDARKVLASVGSGAAGSWQINNLGPRMIDGNFEPGFFVEHFIKDLRIALEEAERLELALPALALAKQLYEAVRAQGYGRKGTHALLLALQTLNGRDGSG